MRPPRDIQERFDDTLTKLSRLMGGAEELQQKLLAVKGEATSEDGYIKVEVGPRGHLIKLELNARIYRRPNAGALAQHILQATQEAVRQVEEQVRKLMDEYVPKEFQIEPFGPPNLKKYERFTDADLLRGGDEDG